jgi:hypothetical protein
MPEYDNTRIVETLEAESVTTDDLDIAGSNFAASGDFFPLGPCYSMSQDNELTTSSSSYQSDVAWSQFPVPDWDKFIPSGTQIAILVNLRLGGGSADAQVRLRDVNQNATVFEETGLNPGETVIRIDNYSPPNKSARSTLRFQVNSQDANNVIARQHIIQTGIQL